jgi:DNA-binding phage protein
MVALNKDGRPRKNAPVPDPRKKYLIGTHLDLNTVNNLDEVARKEGISRSELIRRIITTHPLDIV